MLNDALIDEFFRTGILRLPRALAGDQVQRMQAHLWDFLRAARGIRQEDRATWPVGGVSGFQALSRTPAFAALACPLLAAACDRILGSGRWSWPKTSAMPLVTFLQPGEWRLPHAAWHLDFAPRQAAVLPGLRVLAFLAPVAPQGGGTAVVEGSHRLVERCLAHDADLAHSSAVRRTFARRYAWFRELWSPDGAAEERRARFLSPSNSRGSAQEIDGVTVHVLELIGDPGDVVIMHPWTLHAATPNACRSPRIMLSWSVASQPPSGHPRIDQLP